MTFIYKTLTSNLVFILILTLANNLCFVAVAKIRQKRLERKNTITTKDDEILNLLKENQRLQDEMAAYNGGKPEDDTRSNQFENGNNQDQSIIFQPAFN